ncbi:hypothetical protein RSAG8_02452, partial [Rhizoctonia solani AG-8 WAC10335]
MHIPFVQHLHQRVVHGSGGGGALHHSLTSTPMLTINGIRTAEKIDLGQSRVGWAEATHKFGRLHG